MQKSHTFHHTSPDADTQDSDNPPVPSSKTSRARTFSHSRLHLRTRHGGSKTTSTGLASALKPSLPLQYIPDNLSFVRNPLGSTNASRRASISKDQPGHDAALLPAQQSNPASTCPTPLLSRLAHTYPQNASLLPPSLHAALTSLAPSRPSTATSSTSTPAPARNELSTILQQATRSNPALQSTLRASLSSISASAHALTRRLDGAYYALLSAQDGCRASLSAREVHFTTLETNLAALDAGIDDLRARYVECEAAMRFSPTDGDVPDADGERGSDGVEGYFQRHRAQIAALQARLEHAREREAQAAKRLEGVHGLVRRWSAESDARRRKGEQWWRGVGWTALALLLVLALVGGGLRLWTATGSEMGQGKTLGRSWGSWWREGTVEGVQGMGREKGVKVGVDTHWKTEGVGEVRWRAVMDEL